MLYTGRLFLRPWSEEDAELLYEYAKDPAVGPSAGWPPHTSVENSREIIRDVLSVEENYALCLKEKGLLVGCIGLKCGQDSNLDIPGDEGEIGYWTAVPFWGKGFMPEACRELIRHGFEDLKLKRIWCGYFDGNEKSRRVQEKCGFTYRFTLKDMYWPLMGDIRTEHVNCIEAGEWQKRR